jgi:hypothetical protein
MRFVKKITAALIAHAVSGLYYATTIVAMAVAYYSLHRYGAGTCWAGVFVVLLVSLGLFILVSRRARRSAPADTERKGGLPVRGGDRMAVDDVSGSYTRVIDHGLAQKADFAINQLYLGEK